MTMIFLFFNVKPILRILVDLSRSLSHFRLNATEVASVDIPASGSGLSARPCVATARTSASSPSFPSCFFTSTHSICSHMTEKMLNILVVHELLENKGIGIAQITPDRSA